MTEKRKISKVESLEGENLHVLIKTLMKNMGYTDITQDKELIKGVFKSPITSDKHGFLICQDSLSGNINLDNIINQIKAIRSEEPFATLFLVSSNNISKGFQENISNKYKETISFFGRNSIVKYVDRYIPDYWAHDDMQLMDYERGYKDSILKDSELKSLKIFSDKYQKLLDIFIEPKIIHLDEDPETKTPITHKKSLDQIVKDKKNIIIAGEAGMGKSTLLKRLGEAFINHNENETKRKLPVFITVTEIHQNMYSILKVVENKVASFFPNETLDEILNDYIFVLLIDSIDELEKEKQEEIIKQLNKLFLEKSVRYIIATRNQEKSVSLKGLEGVDTYDIARFNNQQIEQFVNRFFLNQQQRAESLLESLKENRVLEKLPITPLTLSLISILFEENDLEIPATITDIYDNFNSLLVGKPLVTTKIELIDVSFRERILSLYALEVLHRKEHDPMTVEEFKLHFANYYKTKPTPIRKGSLDDFLDYMIENAGVLYLKNDRYVTFSHDSFMEYYASLEIFKHQRGLEKEYIDKFFDINWQNSAIFYAGHSKDMNDFLGKINDKIKEAKNINEYFAAISGAGFILQALFQTDNITRKITVDNALEINIKSLELLMKLASDEKFIFKSFRLPIIWMLNVLNFYDNFNSGTLREPLKLSFEGVSQHFKDNEDETSGFKALILALTLNSKRIGETEYLEDLVYNSPLLENNILTIISEIGLEFFSDAKSKELRSEVKKQSNKIRPVLKGLLNTPNSRMRFSNFDVIHSNKKVKIITEGKTDAILLEHAYMVLTNGETPYWSIRPSGNDSGNARTVNQTLMTSKATTFEEEYIIGIFDHDGEGISEYKRLDNNHFHEVKKNRIKKHNSANIYAVLLPVPGEKSNYLMPDQAYNYFEIEHYLPLEFLKENGALKETPLTKSNGIYSIYDGKKNTIMKKVSESSDPTMVVDFIELLEVIDSITKTENEYYSIS